MNWKCGEKLFRKLVVTDLALVFDLASWAGGCRRWVRVLLSYTGRTLVFVFQSLSPECPALFHLQNELSFPCIPSLIGKAFWTWIRELSLESRGVVSSKGWPGQRNQHPWHRTQAPRESWAPAGKGRALRFQRERDVMRSESRTSAGALGTPYIHGKCVNLTWGVMGSH